MQLPTSKSHAQEHKTGIFHDDNARRQEQPHNIDVIPIHVCHQQRGYGLQYDQFRVYRPGRRHLWVFSDNFHESRLLGWDATRPKRALCLES